MVLPNSLSSYYEKFLATGEVKCIDEEIPFEIKIRQSAAAELLGKCNQ
jgi:hypothetical protein